MLGQRALTAAVLVLLVLAAIFLLPAFPFTLFLAAVVLLAAWEWGGLMGLSSAAKRLGYLLLIVLLLAYSYYLLPVALWPAIFMAAALWWLLACLLVLCYPRFADLWSHPGLLALMGVLVLVPAWLALVYLRGQPQFPQLILLLLALVAAADIGAYFTGRRFGRRKLAVRVSPNKTWEGFWGGVLSCAILAAAVLGYYSLSDASPGVWLWLRLIGFAAVLSMISVVGDLLESMLKRFRNIKDSGNLLPGHGGVLDRIDGIAAVAPVYALLVLNLPGGPA